MKSSSRIYLTGFMGSGKSTLGKRLAAALGYAFIDLDPVIEMRLGHSIPEVFSGGGERAFRKAEREELQNTFSLRSVVVAVGGGALATQNQMDAALRNGVVVYLEARAETLRQRLRGTEDSRPLLKRHTDFEELLTARRPVYERADIILNVDELDVQEAAEALRVAVRANEGGGDSG